MKDLLQNQFDKMCTSEYSLFRSDVTGDQLWSAYLSNFKKEDDPVFLSPESTVHNCNHCNNFIRRYGNIIGVNKDGDLVTLFDGYQELPKIDEYKKPFEAMSKLLKGSKIQNVFLETFDNLKNLNYEKVKKNQFFYRLGIPENTKRYTKEELVGQTSIKPNEVVKFEHFNIILPKEYVSFSDESLESIQAKVKDAKNVFERGLKELSLDTLYTVRDLIEQGSILNGTSYKKALNLFIEEKNKYELCKNSTTIDNYFWVASLKLRNSVSKFRNFALGTLCCEIEKGETLEVACKKWNVMVDPVNYMKAKAPISKKQIEEAEKFVIENGYEESLDRSFVKLSDIKVSEIKHINSGIENITLKKPSVFSNLKSNRKEEPINLNFEKIKTVSPEDFMSKVLPECEEIEAYVENKHENNFVGLTKSKHENSKLMFKWDNDYSWTYNNNLAGESLIKKAVKERGGSIDGVLNIRLHFPNTTDDYDLHVYEPDFVEICYNNLRKKQKSSGILDLDAQGLDKHQPPEKRVENVTYSDLSKMKDGDYIVSINNYSNFGLKSIFYLEIEFGNFMFKYECNFNTNVNTKQCLKITLKNRKFSISELQSKGMTLIESKNEIKEIYGVKTGQFNKVNLVCLSPNYWGNKSQGNKHYMFMLENCISDSKLRTFHIENLNSDLLQHKRVLEVLGQTNLIEPEKGDLFGLGFNSTIPAELVVKCKLKNENKLLKIKF